MLFFSNNYLINNSPRLIFEQPQLILLPSIKFEPRILTIFPH